MSGFWPVNRALTCSNSRLAAAGGDAVGVDVLREEVEAALPAIATTPHDAGDDDAEDDPDPRLDLTGHGRSSGAPCVVHARRDRWPCSQRVSAWRASAAAAAASPRASATRAELDPGPAPDPACRIRRARDLQVLRRAASRRPRATRAAPRL